MTANIHEILQIARIGLWEWDVLTNHTIWGEGKFELFGYEPNEFEVTLENAFETVHPEDRQMIFEVLNANLPINDFFNYEYRGIKKNEDIMYVWVRLRVQRNSEGKAIYVHGISQDITERKLLENKIIELNEGLEADVQLRTKDLKEKNLENELLVKEMHHRVKNNLQVISSILSLQMGYIDDKSVIDTLQQCVNRIKSMALIHDSLYNQENLSEIHLKTYVHRLFELYKNDDKEVEFNVTVPDIVFSVNKMVPLGLIINELVSNSMKHAFPNNEKGSISLTVDCSCGFNMIYEDNGVGLKNDNLKDSPTFGMELITALGDDLKADFNFSSENGHGLKFIFNTNNL